MAMAPPALAQDTAPVTADQAVATARETYGPPDAKKRCPDPKPGEDIVVCATPQDQSQYRVQSSTQTDPTSREAMDTGEPRAPNVDGRGIFTGPATVGNLCIPGLAKCPPPPVYIIDFDALPDPPPGSDADLIARGEKPAG